VGKEFTKKEGGMPIELRKDSEYRSKESDEMKRKAVSGMKKGGKVKKMAGGGEPLPPPPDEVELPKDMFKKKKVKMASGGLAAGHKAADGVAHKGKTKAKKVVMAGNKGMKSGGMAKKYC